MHQRRELFRGPDDPMAEDPKYLSEQLVTYIGNKRSLIGPIGDAVERVRRRLGGKRLRVLDAFSGSGIVSRYLKAHASLLVSNDFEDYAAVIGRCYLRNRSSLDLAELAEIVADLNDKVDSVGLPPGFIAELYAPADESRITKDDRVFYTRGNARRLDDFRRLIASVPAQFKDMLLGPLLSEASVHANTAGVFKGFYKNRETQVGQFGGTGADALVRILGQISLQVPVLSRFECDCEVLQEDANQAARRQTGLDLAYLDPPYNQHPYGSNYFMLNLVANYERPTETSRVSGIPTRWRRSGYNVRAMALPLLKDLIEHIDAPFLLISFNDEGFIAPQDMRSQLEQLGQVETMEIRHNAFRGSRSFANRSIHVTEQLFIVERR
jgi:adenine-specific DNA-methyltransferase